MRRALFRRMPNTFSQRAMRACLFASATALVALAGCSDVSGPTVQRPRAHQIADIGPDVSQASTHPLAAHQRAEVTSSSRCEADVPGRGAGCAFDDDIAR